MARIGGNQSNPNRSDHDFYPTHPKWTEALLDAVQLSGPIWEPACGEGDMVRVLQGRGHEVRATDIVSGTDFLTQTDAWVGDIVTNPPYRLLDQFLHVALGLASGRVAMLVPIGALGGQKRYDALWSRRRAELIIVVASRMPVFGKASQFNHCWAVFNNAKRVNKTELVWAK